MKTTREMELVAVEKLVPYVNNARTHSPEQINKLRASLRMIYRWPMEGLSVEQPKAHKSISYGLRIYKKSAKKLAFFEILWYN